MKLELLVPYIHSLVLRLAWNVLSPPNYDASRALLGLTLEIAFRGRKGICPVSKMSLPVNQERILECHTNAAWRKERKKKVDTQQQ